MALLSLQDVSKGYGDIGSDPTFSATSTSRSTGRARRYRRLFGRGKTTLMSMMAGLIPADAGTLTSTVSRLRSPARARRGLSELLRSCLGSRSTKTCVSLSTRSIRLVGGEEEGPLREVHRDGQLDPRARQAPGAALRRHAATRVGRPRAGDGADDALDGRAVRRARRAHARRCRMSWRRSRPQPAPRCCSSPTTSRKRCCSRPHRPARRWTHASLGRRSRSTSRGRAAARTCT